MGSPVFGYRPTTNRNLIPSGCPVEVVVSYKTTGEFIPLYFRITDDNQERFTYKINSISSMKDKPGIKIYVCTFISNGYKNPIVLQFDETNCCWVIG